MMTGSLLGSQVGQPDGQLQAEPCPCSLDHFLPKAPSPFPIALKDDPRLLTGPGLSPVVPLHALDLTRERACILTLATPEGLVKDV